MDISTNQVDNMTEHGLDTRSLHVQNRIGSFRERWTCCFHPRQARSKFVFSLL